MILVRVVTREMEGEHLASKANRRLVALLDRLPEALVLTDVESGRVVFMNETARSLIGTAPDKSVIMQLSQLLTRAEGPERKGSRRENDVDYAERRFELRDDRGRRMPVVGSGRTVRDEDRRLSLHLFRPTASA